MSCVYRVLRGALSLGFRGVEHTVCAAKHSFSWDLSPIERALPHAFSATPAAPAYSKLMCYANRENSQ